MIDNPIPIPGSTLFIVGDPCPQEDTLPRSGGLIESAITWIAGH